jgi:hypothetical protein
MAKVTLVYIGMRLYGADRSYCYEDVSDGSDKSILTFKVKLCKLEIIGTVIESDVEGSIYRGSKIIRSSDHKDPWYPKVQEWFIANLAANENYQALLDARKFKDGPIDDLIKRFRDQCWGISRQEKVRIARYIFEQLTK